MLGAAALGVAATLQLGACGSGYGGAYGDWGPPGPAAGLPTDLSGRLAIAWTLNGMPLTSAICQAENIDAMEVIVTAAQDSQSQVEFENVVCGLDRYSMAMIPSGSVSLQVNALHNLNSQIACTRYAGIAYATATTDFPKAATPVTLLSVVSCP